MPVVLHGWSLLLGRYQGWLRSCWCVALCRASPQRGSRCGGGLGCRRDFVSWHSRLVLQAESECHVHCLWPTQLGIMPATLVQHVLLYWEALCAKPGSKVVSGADAPVPQCAPQCQQHGISTPANLTLVVINRATVCKYFSTAQSACVPAAAHISGKSSADHFCHWTAAGTLPSAGAGPIRSARAFSVLAASKTSLRALSACGTGRSRVPKTTGAGGSVAVGPGAHGF